MAEKTLLDDIMIAAPCPASWQNMSGDERVRFCQSCQKNVYNISEMTRKEATELLQANGTTQCMRIYRRADGTVITDNCPVGLRQLRQRCRKALKFVSGIFSLIVGSAPAAQAEGPGLPTAGLPSPAVAPPKKAPTSAPQPEAVVGSTLMGIRTPAPHVVIVPATPSSTLGVWVRRPSAEKPQHIPIVRTYVQYNGTKSSGIDTMQVPAALLEPYIPPRGFDQSMDGQLFDPFSSKPGFGQGEEGSGLIKLRASYDVVVDAKIEAPVHADLSALTLYQKARLFEDQGKLLLSLTHFKDALKACSQQVGADPVFKRFLEAEVERMNGQFKESDAADFGD